MNKSFKRRVEQIEQVVGLSGHDDLRAYSYPNDRIELVLMAKMSQDKVQQYLRTRRNRPSPEICDQFDNLFEQIREDRKS